MTIKEYEIERDAKERTEHYQENLVQIQSAPLI